MGGYGSLMPAMRHLDLFAAVAALSSGVLTDDEVKGMEDDGWARTFSTPFGRDRSGHVTLRDRQIPHEFRVRDGGHSWSYWRTGIRDALRFIGESFHR